MQRTEIRRGDLRRSPFALPVLLALSVALVGCPPTSPNTPPSPSPGNLQLWSAFAQQFQATIAQDPAAFNSGQLLEVPNISIATAGLNVRYDDGFSTDASQTEIVVFARDPLDMETTLESFAGVNTTVAFEAQVQAPGDSGAITLPDAVSIPYPVDQSFNICGRNGVCTGGSSGTTRQDRWSVSLGQFTGSNATPLSGNAGNSSGVKGMYLFNRGVCAYDVDIQSVILSQFTSALPPQVRAAVENGLAKDVAKVATPGKATVVLNAVSYVDRQTLSAPVGGLITKLDVGVTWNVPLVPLSNTFESLNYTYQFVLTNGILSFAPTQNNQYHSGTFAETIEGQIVGQIPPAIVGTLYMQSLAQQAQAIPAPNGPASCSGPNPRPSSCFIPCAPPLPSPLPAQLSPTNTDDSAWYNTSYCSRLANALYDAAAAGDGAYGTIPTNVNVAQLLTAFRPDNANLYQNVRCNFYPTYETDTQAVPVCEVVARAKRINVFPDTVELVFFDGPDLQHVGSSEYGNEAFALYLALLGAKANPNILCARPEELAVRTRRFARGVGSDYP
jgi:hypothetical protein